MESPLQDFQPKDRSSELLEKDFFLVFLLSPEKIKVTLFPVLLIRALPPTQTVLGLSRVPPYKRTLDILIFISKNL